MRRRRWLLAGVVAALFVALVALGGYWAFVFYVALLAAAAAWILTYPSLRRLEIHRYCSCREAEVGERVDVRVRLVNRGLLPIPWLLVEDMVLPDTPTSGVRGELTWLMPGQELKLEYQVLCERRGYYRTGPVLIETGDYFGLLRRFAARRPLQYLTVRPRPVPLGRLIVPTSRPVAEVRARFALLDDPTRPAGVRDYRRGDPLRRIHWKATAHTGKLHSRIYEPAVLQGAMIVLDFAASSWPDDRKDQAELAVTVAASIAAHMRERNQKFALVSNGLDGARMIEAWPAELDVASRREAMEILGRREPPERFEPVTVPPGHGDETLELVLGALARLQPGTGLTLEEMVRREHPAWPRELAAVLVVPGMGAAVIRSVGVLRDARFAVVVIAVGDERELAASARLSEAGVATFAVASEEALQAIAL